MPWCCLRNTHSATSVTSESSGVSIGLANDDEDEDDDEDDDVDDDDDDDDDDDATVMFGSFSTTRKTCACGS